MDEKTIIKYITGNASLEEKREVLLWVEQEEDNKKEFMALREMHDLLLWQNEGDNEASTRNNKKKSFISGLGIELLKIAAVFLVAFLILYPLQRRPIEVLMQKIYVPSGQRVELTLTDGTHVWLNSGSTFTYPNNFTDNKREVILDGEGYFKVCSNAQKPFVVKTLQYNIKALGTEFNVQAYYNKASTFSVALLEGKVEVSDQNNGNVILEQNTMVYLSNGILQKKGITEYNNLLWREGLICFDNESVEELIDKLQLFYDIRIDMQNKSLIKKRYSGKFRAKDGIEHILKVLQLQNKFTYIKDDEKNLIIIK